MIQIEEIIKIASVETGISVDRILSRDRTKEYVFARRVYIYLARTQGYSFPAIGKAINKDHTTAIHAYAIAKNDENVLAIASRRILVGKNDSLNMQMERVCAHGKYAHVYEFYGGKCYVCSFNEIVEVHHIIPRSLGGKDLLENLILLCPNHHALADRGQLDIKDIHKP